MKNRKNLGCSIKDPKERGAWAEPYFMALAAGQGTKVLCLQICGRLLSTLILRKINEEYVRIFG